ncbi:MAG: antitoxin [Verrucomicrobiota bacterium]
MKTTIDLPDDLVRRMKLKAVREGKKFREVAAEVFRKGLTEQAKDTNSRRVQLPLIQCELSKSVTELNPEQIADVLNKQEEDWVDETPGR